MDFSLTEDRRMLAESLSRLLRDACPIEMRNAVAYEAPFHSPDLWGKLAELGAPAALFSEEAGGFGGAGFDIATVFETLGGALCPEPMLGVAMAGAVLGAGDPLTEGVIAGSTRIAVGLWEADGGLSSRVEGEKLTGRKSVLYGGQAADAFLVSAEDAAGPGLFAVQASDAKVEGYAMIDGAGAAEVIFEAAPCRRIGGAEAITAAETAGLVALCGEAVGVMDALIKMTVEYLKTRRQFGRAIGDFQALQHRMVDLTVELEQARSITIVAANAYGADEGPLKASMAKNLIGRAGKLIAEEAIQMHGGIAMTWEAAVSHYAKRLIMIGHQLGDADEHLQRVMAA